MNNQQIADVLVEISEAASKEIIKIYHTDFEAEYKADESPLTLADKNANQVIVNGLKENFPEIPIISEETKNSDYSERKHWKRCFIVDPLDGTKEFIKKNDEFTVNIALVENGKPILGVVYVPVVQVAYVGLVEEKTAYKIEKGFRISISPSASYKNKTAVKVVASRSHNSPEVMEFVQELQERGKEIEFISAGSSLKFCLIAEGSADVYPRFGPTMEWDTAAAHAVVLAAGKQVLHHDKLTPLLYNKENLLNPWFIVA